MKSILKVFIGIVCFLALMGLKPIKIDKWVNLFNGKDFTGWQQKGGKALYEVKQGEIVGTTVTLTSNSFLCTEKIYKNFILEFEVKVDTALNSGVQFRSNSRPEYKDGVVHGYQCEIDPSPRAWSGGIYDEQRRGWLYNPIDDVQAQGAFKPQGWNKYKIEAIGSKIKTWVNDVPVSNIKDSVETSGFIGLQVHSINKPHQVGKHVLWRNIRILEL